MTDKIAIERKILEHTVIALEYAYGADDVLIAESIRFLRHALAQKAEPDEQVAALQKIADFGRDQERPSPSQAKSLALLDLDSVEHMQGGANGPTIRLRGFINAQTGPTAPQPPIDNAFVAEGCEQFSTPTEPAEPVASYWLIECKNGFTGWYTGKRLDCRFFDTDPHKAYKFTSKELAENEISERGHSCMIATEHVDIAAPPATPKGGA